MPEPALVAVDESTSGHYVTAGAVRIAAANVPFVLAAVSDLKRHYGIPVDAEIHCRELFAVHARQKSAFKDLGPTALIPFLLECIWRTRLAGCSWFATHCDSTKYPKMLQMPGGSDFKLEQKHIAGLLAAVCGQLIFNITGQEHKLIFDKDPTKIDWGLARLMQTTHFVANSPDTIEMRPEYSPLLELADIAAYVHGREISSRAQPANWKLTRFAAVSRAMQLQSSEFGWFLPDLQGGPEL